MKIMNSTTNPQPLFPLGHCCMTPGIQELITQYQFPIADYIHRHQTGDWGELSAEDQQENALSLREGYRILSAYSFAPNAEFSTQVWIITEADRSSTTVLLPSEY